MLSTQSRRIEKTAKSVDEAIEFALSELGATKDMVEIEVLEEASKGLFGILGSKDAKVLVTLKQTAKTAAIDFLNELFFAMGMRVDVQVSETDEMLDINLVGDDMGIIIGKEAIHLMQYSISQVLL